MKLDFQAESIKSAPAFGGVVTSIIAKAQHLDWATLAAQATFFYVILQGAYLLWKWNRERKNGIAKNS